MSTQLNNPFEYYSYDFSQYKKLNNLQVKNCRFFFDYAQSANINPSGVINNDFYTQPTDNIFSNTYINWEDCQLVFLKNGEMLPADSQINPNHWAQLFNLDPTIQTAFDSGEFVTPSEYHLTGFQLQVPLRNFMPLDKWINVEFDKLYVAVLGHNLYSSGCDFSLSGNQGSFGIPSEFTSFNGFHTLLPINFRQTSEDSGICMAVADGYSITPYSQTESSSYIQPTDTLYFTFLSKTAPLYVNTINPLSIGCISFGEYYDVPIATNFGSRINFDYEGAYNTPNNIGGERHVVNNFQAPPPWTHYLTDDNRQIALQPWTLSEEFKQFRGRRTWEVEFGGILEADLFPERFDNIAPSGANYTKEYSDSIYSRLITQLPNNRFMFMPDTTDPHNIAICKLDGEVEISKQTHGIYNISLNVREVW